MHNVLNGLTYFAIALIFTYGNIFFIRSIPEDSKRNNLSYIIYLITIFGGFIACSILIPQSDFIYDYNWDEMLYILLSSVAIYFTSSLYKNSYLTYITILLICSLYYFFAPQDYTIIGYNGYDFAKIIMIAALFIFTISYKLLNRIDGILPLQSSFIGLSVFIFSLFGAAPIMLGLFGIIISAVNLTTFLFNRYPSQIQLNTATIYSMSIVIGWLIIRTQTEASFSSVMVILAFFLIELVTSILKRLTFMNKYRNILNNSIIYQANISGLSPSIIILSVFKIFLLALILSFMQIYADNNYSIPILSFLVTAWLLSRIANWDTPIKGFKETSKEVFSDLKENIQEAKKIIGKE